MRLPRLHPLGVTVVAALQMLAITMSDLPSWWALAVLVTWLLWASCEVAIWFLELRVDRRRRDVRALIERELASIPRRDAPTRRDILTIASEFPKAWQPFVEGATRRTTAKADSCPR